MLVYPSGIDVSSFTLRFSHGNCGRTIVRSAPGGDG